MRARELSRGRRAPSIRPVAASWLAGRCVLGRGCDIGVVRARARGFGGGGGHNGLHHAGLHDVDGSDRGQRRAY